LDVLIIGGTRNLGHLLTVDLLQSGHRVTLLNRGQTPDTLSPDVRRLRADRSNPAQLKQALAGSCFDAVVDTTLYNGRDAEVVTRLLDGRVGHYIFLSSGQVYLVRSQLQRPFVEDDYQGPTIPEPPAGSRDHDEWLYGVEKRQAEELFFQAWQRRRFPFTTLRLPMVNSVLDHFHRIYGYLLRLRDGGPILLPAGPHLPVRHVWGADVVRAIASLIQTGKGKGQAYNLSQQETLSIEDFLTQLATLAQRPLKLACLDRSVLNAHQLLPGCSPFSNPWMSELDNRRSKAELGIQYTPLPDYLRELVAYYESHPQPMPPGYQRRSEELQLAG
jgi:nucleoside-diphosphate-sugar epimerase